MRDPDATAVDIPQHHLPEQAVPIAPLTVLSELLQSLNLPLTAHNSLVGGGRAAGCESAHPGRRVRSHLLPSCAGGAPAEPARGKRPTILRPSTRSSPFLRSVWHGSNSLIKPGRAHPAARRLRIRRCLSCAARTKCWPGSEIFTRRSTSPPRSPSGALSCRSRSVTRRLRASSAPSRAR